MQTGFFVSFRSHRSSRCVGIALRFKIGTTKWTPHGGGRMGANGIRVLAEDGVGALEEGGKTGAESHGHTVSVLRTSAKWFRCIGLA